MTVRRGATTNRFCDVPAASERRFSLGARDLTQGHAVRLGEAAVEGRHLRPHEDASTDSENQKQAAQPERHLDQDLLHGPTLAKNEAFVKSERESRERSASAGG